MSDGDIRTRAAARCGELVYWWNGEYEGWCEREADHDGPHFDGTSWYDDDMDEVPAPEGKPT